MAKFPKDTLSRGRRGAFNLTKFFSNIPGAIDAYPKAETKTLHLDQQPLHTKRTLGLEWDSESDCFVFAVEGWQGDSTRRSLLSYVASVFDPLGLVAPCVLPSKLLIQDLTRRKADWDETMTTDEISHWKYCLRELQSVRQCLQAWNQDKIIRTLGDKGCK